MIDEVEMEEVKQDVIALDESDISVVDEDFVNILKARARRDALTEQIRVIQNRIDQESTPEVNAAIEKYQKTVQLVAYKHGISDKSEDTWVLSEDRRTLTKTPKKDT